MDWDLIQANWTPLESMIHSQWSRLTQDNIYMIAGKRDLLGAKLQQIYGINKDEANKQINAFANSMQAIIHVK
ncbi:hypothetical protein [Methylophilus sp. OH31]|uniref:hypothetical protein n=1 Tax=Methylophilus sp. OH31 TaxID=1387312 RepID=UPI0004655217|nr:hypothetical protein [Methylophilus sp. OH31]